MMKTFEIHRPRTGEAANLLPQADYFSKCFFRKADLRPGTLLVNQGRRLGGTLWEVAKIQTHNKRTGGWKTSREVLTLGDYITLTNPGFPDVVRTFGSLSYSAIWWLA